jgi:predicted small secreted protein
VNDSFGSYYFLNISALRKGSRNVSEYVDLFVFSDSPISDGKTYDLKKSKIDNRAEGSYLYSNVETRNSFETQNQDFVGKITITKIDETNQFISGTFMFDAINDKGEEAEVREGRFDVKYLKY